MRRAGRLTLGWENAKESLWFFPALMSVGAVLLAQGLLHLDQRIDPDLGRRYDFLFGGTAEAAWTLLQVIAGSLITVVSVAFSVTMIAIQQASTQYSPRVLRNFTRDRGNQLVLGTYIATFTYALMVLRQIREDTSGREGFVPPIAIFTAIVLALVSVGMLIYFIHHVSRSLQVNYLVSLIRSDLDEQLEELYPEQFGTEGADPASAQLLLKKALEGDRLEERVVRAKREGYLRDLGEHALERALAFGPKVASVPVKVGDYVHKGAILVRVWFLPGDEPPADFEARAQAAFETDSVRTVHQDPLFAIRQLVDIAVKALSPSTNDPTTAEQALDQLGGALVCLAQRQMPSPERVLEHGVRCIFERPSFGDYVEASFASIRRAASGQLHVQLHLLTVLQAVAQRIPDDARARPLRAQLRELAAMLEDAPFTQNEVHRVRQRACEVLEILDRHVATQIEVRPGEEPHPPH